KIFVVRAKFSVVHLWMIFSKLSQSVGRRFLTITEVVDKLRWRSDVGIAEDFFHLLGLQSQSKPARSRSLLRDCLGGCTKLTSVPFRPVFEQIDKRVYFAEFKNQVHLGGG